ncbi:MAG: GNAT family N-acetyltransferase [Bacteroidetes bacterium]|nr:GNAT family N-acetyltransferase [Bacteroidota bacterium]
MYIPTKTPPVILTGSVSCGDISFEEYSKLMKAYSNKVFQDAPQLRIPLSEDTITSDWNRNFSNFQAQCFYICRCIFKDNEPIGWFYGIQEKARTFNMINTGILPEHQGQGIYTALLHQLIIELTGLGFTVVKSQHSLNNNHVLIPKLKKGFVISGIEVFSGFGTLVHLAYFVNPNEKKAFSYKIGRIPLDPEIESWIIK